MEQNKDNRHESQKLPDDVHNAAQDPSSMRDPLQQQLSKSQDQNGLNERRTLDKLNEQYGPEGEQR